MTAILGEEIEGGNGQIGIYSKPVGDFGRCENGDCAVLPEVAVWVETAEDDGYHVCAKCHMDTSFIHPKSDPWGDLRREATLWYAEHEAASAGPSNGGSG